MKLTDQRSDLFILAAEPSGDALGAYLMDEISRHYPQWHIIGVGGSQMKNRGLTLLAPIEDFQVMGFTGVVMALPRLWTQFVHLRNLIVKSNPPMVVLIDYPGFNLRLAAALRKRGYKGKIVQMVCPTVWAWGKGRIDTLVKNYDLLLTIFPFELESFADTTLDVRYIGHPLIPKLVKYKHNSEWRQSLMMSPHKALVGIFPGSRSGEIAKNLPQQLAIAKEFFRKHPEVAFGISCCSEEKKNEIRKLLRLHGEGVMGAVTLVGPNHTYELMRDCRAAIATSGTITLELALHQTPTLVTYKLSIANLLIARFIFGINLPHYCIVNIIAGRTVFPEMIRPPIFTKNGGLALCELFEDTDMRRNSLLGCRDVYEQLTNRELMSNPLNAIKETLVEGIEAESTVSM